MQSRYYLSNKSGDRLHCLNETTLAIGQQQMNEHLSDLNVFDKVYKSGAQS